MASQEIIPDQNAETRSTDLNLVLWNPGVNKGSKGVSAVRNMIVTKAAKTVKRLVPQPIMFVQESLEKRSMKKWGINECYYHQDRRITGTSGHRSGLYTPPSATLQDWEDCDLTRYFFGDKVVHDLDERTIGQIIHLGHQSKLFRTKLVIVSVHMPYILIDAKTMYSCLWK